MARVFITGSADGLGKMTAQLLVEQGHSVVLHARYDARGTEALNGVPGAESVVIGDLSSIRQTRGVADQVNALRSFDAVIHNVGYRQARRVVTEDGLPNEFAVNTLAPYNSYGTDQQTETACVPEFHVASTRGCKLGGLGLERASMAGTAGILGYQTARRTSRVRHCATLARCPVERS